MTATRGCRVRIGGFPLIQVYRARLLSPSRPWLGKITVEQNAASKNRSRNSSL